MQKSPKMIIDFDENHEPLHCGVKMGKSGSNASGTKLCQRYKCRICLRVWTDVKKPFVKFAESEGEN